MLDDVKEYENLETRLESVINDLPYNNEEEMVKPYYENFYNAVNSASEYLDAKKNRSKAAELYDIEEINENVFNRKGKLNKNFSNEITEFLNIDESQFDNPNLEYIEIGEVSPETIKVAKDSGVDLTGYTHIIDMSGKNHFKNGHIGKKKGLDDIPLSEDDIKNIPNVIYKPDGVVFRKGHGSIPNKIEYAKNMPDGTIVYVEYAQTQKKACSKNNV